MRAQLNVSRAMVKEREQKEKRKVTKKKDRGRRNEMDVGHNLYDGGNQLRCK